MSDPKQSKLAEAIALRRARQGGGDGTPAPGSNETPPPISQASAVADRMRQDQADRTAVVLFVTQIEVRKQVRTTFDNLDVLAASIREHGLLQPIVVKQIEQFRYLLISGERRLRAVRDLLKQDMIAARIVEASDVQKIRILQLAENVQREDLAPLEMARELAAIKDEYKWRNREIAINLGISEGWVSKKLSLLEAPAEVRAKIESGELSETEYYNNKKTVTEKTKGPSESTNADVRTPMVSIPLSTATAVAELLAALAKKGGANPVELSDKPTKKELIAILNSRVKELRRLV